MRTPSGFTLIEVVVALIVLEVAVVGVLGSLVLSTRIMHQAESVERATARAEGVLDSLSAGASPGAGNHEFEGGAVEWVVSPDGAVSVLVTTPREGAVVLFRSRVALR